MGISFTENLPDVVEELENILDRYNAHFNYSNSELMHEYVQYCQGLGVRDSYPDPELIYFNLLENSTKNLIEKLLDSENNLWQKLKSMAENSGEIKEFIVDYFSEEFEEYKKINADEDLDNEEVYEQFIDLSLSAFEKVDFKSGEDYEIDGVTEFSYNANASNIYINGEILDENTFEKNLIEFFVKEKYCDLKEQIVKLMKEEKENNKALTQAIEIDLSTEEKVNNVFNKKI